MERQRFTIKILPAVRDAESIFAELAELVRETAPEVERVEHIGSTSVPGLAGKGIIDCLAIGPEEAMDDIQQALTEAGMSDNSSAHPDPDRWYASGTFTRRNGARTHVHIHITYPGTVCERDHLAFRDRLRADRLAALRYVKLKHEWRAAAGHDRVQFTEAKTPFVQEILNETPPNAGPEKRQVRPHRAAIGPRRRGVGPAGSGTVRLG